MLAIIFVLYFIHTTILTNNDQSWKASEYNQTFFLRELLLIGPATKSQFKVHTKLLGIIRITYEDKTRSFAKLATNFLLKEARDLRSSSETSMTKKTRSNYMFHESCASGEIRYSRPVVWYHHNIQGVGPKYRDV